MTKKEMIDTINESTNMVDDLITSVNEVLDYAKRLQRKLESLPAEVDEIDEDTKEEPEAEEVEP